MQTTPIASSTNAFVSVDIEAFARVECDPDLTWASALDARLAAIRDIAQRRKDAEKNIREKLCAFVPLRENVFIDSPVPPNSFTFLDESFDAFRRVRSL